MRTVVQRFEEVRAYRQKTGKCPSCGRRSVRKFTDYMTVNPFNTNDDGTPKTYAQVKAAIDAKADAWVPDFEHSTCKEKRLA